MSDTFVTRMQGIPADQIARARAIVVEKDAKVVAYNEAITNMATMSNTATADEALFGSTRNCSIGAAQDRVGEIVHQFDVDYPGDAPHSAVYGFSFPQLAPAGTGGNMYDFTIEDKAFVVVYTGTPGLDAVIDANSARKDLMISEREHVNFGSIRRASTLAAAVALLTLERDCFAASADLYDAVYP
jgi:hypothetical protein